MNGRGNPMRCSIVSSKQSIRSLRRKTQANHQQRKGAAVSADLSRLTNIVEAFPQQRIVLVGDFVADQYVSGEISRVSREAPVLIIRHRETQLVPGGGANAANNIAALGARVTPVSAVGDDESGRGLTDYFKR